MERYDQTKRTRRDMLWAIMAVPTTVVLASYAGLTGGRATSQAFAQGALLPPTPACTDTDDVTPRQTEGPFYKPRSPERTSLLEPGMTGTPILLTGHVLSRRCQPIAHALLDFWQADGQGQYDNEGYRCRGHQFTDEAGRYRLETVVPGLYAGRTRHIHVKVQAPNRPVLTTQLYFPEEPRNARDGIFNPALLMAIQDTANGKVASFNFIMDII
ncbi:MAG TPA: intradiol ring-cleavage dioxygenase [Candidatus Tectomicrobia bacterium]|nr:intradiol ring-cleavage dioxygenase [Candidatus Tectomicrobia bacterium]